MRVRLAGAHLGHLVGERALGVHDARGVVHLVEQARALLHRHLLLRQRGLQLLDLLAGESVRQSRAREPRRAGRDLREVGDVGVQRLGQRGLLLAAQELRLVLRAQLGPLRAHVAQARGQRSATRAHALLGRARRQLAGLLEVGAQLCDERPRQRQAFAPAPTEGLLTSDGFLQLRDLPLVVGEQPPQALQVLRHEVVERGLRLLEPEPRPDRRLDTRRRTVFGLFCAIEHYKRQPNT